MEEPFRIRRKILRSRDHDRKTGHWDWFGHMGAFPGFLTRTVAVPQPNICFRNNKPVDGPSSIWSDAILYILQKFEERGAPKAKTKKWEGRWWDLWNTLDFVAMGDRVLVTDPSLQVPFRDASEITLTVAIKVRFLPPRV
ncbi:MAG: hypothetical protein CM1200mP4_3450 [Rhodospirillaceae bacterium]|nr:MAG: hypothetical protein CM1200mP4_3450 [Rhodospirillaceae bacterium]